MAQTSTGAPVTAERELRHVWTQPLAKVTARAGFQVQRSKLRKIFRGFELWRTKVQGPCPALQVACSSVSNTLLLSRQRVPWVRRSFSLQICTHHRIMGSFSWVIVLFTTPFLTYIWGEENVAIGFLHFGADCELRCPGMQPVSDRFYSVV